MKNPYLMPMLLKWIRMDKTEREKGFTLGYLAAVETQIESWEMANIYNILNARIRGVNA